MIIDNGAYPSPLNYGGFPKSVCTSLNECICHGIPDTTELVEGDIVNVDVTVFLNGYHGDTSRTICVGAVSEEVQRLVGLALPGVRVVTWNTLTLADILAVIRLSYWLSSGYHTAVIR
jgi:methionine aminopeptidase